jgi:urease accessory protein
MTGTAVATATERTGAAPPGGAPGRQPEDAGDPLGEGLDAAVFARLAAWFSPAFPVGAFAYSHGLEALEAAGGLRGAADAEAAVAIALADGGGWSDLVLLAAAFRAAAAGDAVAVEAIRELALALAPSAERRGESVRQGNAFAAMVDALTDSTAAGGGDHPYPVAVGLRGARLGVPLGPLAHAFALAFVANLVSAAVRLVPLGQTDGQRLIRDLAPLAARTARAALAATLDDVGGAAIGLDVAAMRHETQEVRLFRS